MAAQHGHNNGGNASSAEHSEREPTFNSAEAALESHSRPRGGGETSTSTQGNRQMKVINKKLITLSTQKQGRNAAPTANATPCTITW